MSAFNYILVTDYGNIITAQKFSSNNTNEENDKESAAVPSVDSETIGAAHSEL
jgi:hypothetical protein